MKKSNQIALQLKTLPSKPGVYEFFDANDKIIYVGKAKNLKNRVSSYFSRNSFENRKLKILVDKIIRFEHIVVDTESDALLLENNLIKKYQPRYNVLLKDDKSFPWICIKNEPFPRVFSTRHVIKDGSIYFGPYTSVVMVKTLLDLIRQLYLLRTCNFNLSKTNIESSKYKVCLEYHIGNCKGPCEGLQTEEDYDSAIQNIKKIVGGNIKEVEEYLKELMAQYAEVYKFEEARIIKEKIDILKKYQSRSTIVNPKISNIDIFSITDDESNAYVNFIKVVNGGIIQSHTIEIKKKLDESKEDLLPIAITEIRQRVNSTSKEIVLQFPLDIEITGVKLTVPARGDKKKLLELSERNVKFYKSEVLRRLENYKINTSVNRILNTIKEDLRLKEIPEHIECFDNSNIHGKFPVAACVVFKDGKPSKKDYRHYNIKTVEGIDDFASMKEVVLRRYKRLMDEESEMPQLIVVDGGKGQLSAAVESLKQLSLFGKIAIVGIAKRLEELYFPGDSVPLYLNKSSETLKILQYLRNEAHRFGITFHRNKRSENFLNSELDSINGIGEKTKEKLFNHFKSIDKIKSVNDSELISLLGKAKASIVIDYFAKK